MAQRPVLGLQASGADVEVARGEIKGSTTIVELLRMFPNGEAGRLMAELSLPCAHCGGAFHEPLTMAAKRHRRDPRAVIDAFRALTAGGPGAAGKPGFCQRRHRQLTARGFPGQLGPARATCRECRPLSG